MGLQFHHEDDGDGARFQVWQDGTLLWESSWLTNYDAALPLEVAVTAGALKLVTSPGDGGEGDTTAWLDLRVAPP